MIFISALEHTHMFLANSLRDTVRVARENSRKMTRQTAVDQDSVQDNKCHGSKDINNSNHGEHINNVMGNGYHANSSHNPVTEDDHNGRHTYGNDCNKHSKGLGCRGSLMPSMNIRPQGGDGQEISTSFNPECYPTESKLEIAKLQGSPMETFRKAPAEVVDHAVTHTFPSQFHPNQSAQGSKSETLLISGQTHVKLPGAPKMDRSLTRQLRTPEFVSKQQEEVRNMTQQLADVCVSNDDEFMWTSGVLCHEERTYRHHHRVPSETNHMGQATVVEQQFQNSSPEFPSRDTTTRVSAPLCCSSTVLTSHSCSPGRTNGGHDAAPPSSDQTMLKQLCHSSEAPTVNLSLPHQNSDSLNTAEMQEHTIYTVTLRRQSLTEIFGFKFVSGLVPNRERFQGDCDYYISQIVPNSIAGRNLLMKVGDTIVYINGNAAKLTSNDRISKTIKQSLELKLVLQRCTAVLV